MNFGVCGREGRSVLCVYSTIHHRAGHYILVILKLLSAAVHLLNLLPSGVFNGGISST